MYRLPWEATVHMSSGLCGSEPYIAPEQFLGKRKLKHDISFAPFDDPPSVRCSPS